MSSNPQKQCPKCGSTNVAYILYGMPAFDDELDKQLAEGKVRLGGCESDSYNPTWHCNECDSEWGGRSNEPPQLTDDELITVVLPIVGGDR